MSGKGSLRGDGEVETSEEGERGREVEEGCKVSDLSSQFELLQRNAGSLQTSSSKEGELTSS